jgi:ribosomal protein S18 acetylase RimI-like enzyme
MIWEIAALSDSEERPCRMESPIKIRHTSPDDYTSIVTVLDEWWGGRQMSAMLPKLFFTHFCDTSFVVELDGKIIGFLVGFLSQSHPTEAYIHFVGIHPNFRKQEVGSILYRKFFRTAQAFDRVRVKCVTSPLNKSSIAYHLRLGFEPEPSETQENGVPYHLNYDGSGEHRVLFVKHLKKIAT